MNERTENMRLAVMYRRAHVHKAIDAMPFPDVQAYIDQYNAREQERERARNNRIHAERKRANNPWSEPVYKGEAS